MQVPLHDMLFRFIPDQSKCWSKTWGRPRPPAFKDKDDELSVWNIKVLLQNGVAPEQLRVGTFQDHGEAYLTTGDYFDTACQAVQIKGIPLQIVVAWRPEEEYVKLGWHQWAYAHVQVEPVANGNVTAEDHESVCVMFRQQLTLNVRRIVPPARYRA